MAYVIIRFWSCWPPGAFELSISKLRDMFDKKGCQLLMGLIAVLTLGGMLYSGTCQGMFRGNEGAQNTEGSQAVATVAGQAITGQEIDALVAQARRQQQLPSNDPQAEFGFYAGAIDQAISQKALGILAKEKGVVISNESVTSFLEKQKPAMVESQKQSLLQSGKLKPNFTQAEFDKAFKDANGGKTVDQSFAEQLKSIIDQLKDPAKASEITPRLQVAMMTAEYASKVNATIDQLKDSYTSYQVLQLAVNDPAKKPEENKVAAEKALAEIKAGAKFENEIKKYNKNASTTPFPILKKSVETDLDKAFLKSMKPGEVSGVQTENGTPTLYKLVEIKQDLPPDFEKSKDSLLQSYKEREAQAKLSEELKAITEGKDVVYGEPLFAVVHDIAQGIVDAQKKGIVATSKSMKELTEKISKIEPKSALAMRLKPLARYVSFEMYFSGLVADDKKQAREARTEVLQEALENVESTRVRLDLYENFVELGKFEDAGQALVETAKNNTGFDPMSIVASGDIESKIAAAEKAGKVPKDMIELAKKEIQRWKDERAAEEKQREADAKAQKSASSSVDKDLEKLNDPEAVKKNSTGPAKK